MSDTNEIIHYESFLIWDDEGKPSMGFKEMITKEVLEELPVAALSLPYKRSDKEIFLNEDPEFEGKTNAEVMNIRLARKAAQGCMTAIKAIQDRVLGKPKQQIESRSITETYTQYLERIGKEDEDTLREAQVNQL